MKVYVVLKSDMDPYCGNWIEAIYKTRKDAERFVDDNPRKSYDPFWVEEWEVIENEEK